MRMREREYEASEGMAEELTCLLSVQSNNKLVKNHNMFFNKFSIVIDGILYKRNNTLIDVLFVTFLGSLPTIKLTSIHKSSILSA